MQALLHLLLKLSESVTRLESLLLIVSPEKENSSSPEINVPSHLSHIEEGVEDR
jgi:hypothetical protein